MNVPAIRKALERLDANGCHWGHPLERAVVRVGLRACDEWRVPSCDECGNYRTIGYRCRACEVTEARIEVIAEILREAGVEVSE